MSYFSSVPVTTGFPPRRSRPVLRTSNWPRAGGWSPQLVWQQTVRRSRQTDTTPQPGSRYGACPPPCWRSCRKPACTRTCTSARTCSPKSPRISTGRTGGTARHSPRPPTTAPTDWIFRASTTGLTSGLTDIRSLTAPRSSACTTTMNSMSRRGCSPASQTRWRSGLFRSAPSRMSTELSWPTAGTTGSTGATSDIRARERIPPTGTLSFRTAMPESSNQCDCAHSDRWASGRQR